MRWTPTWPPYFLDWVGCFPSVMELKVQGRWLAQQQGTNFFLAWLLGNRVALKF